MSNPVTTLAAGLPAGYRNNNGTFNNIGNNANFWSASENNTNNAWNRNLNYNNSDINRNNNNKENGFSVRCVRDWYSECHKTFRMVILSSSKETFGVLYYVEHASCLFFKFTR